MAKYLGMYIDANLKWDEHINIMIPKMSSKIGILRSLRKIVPTDTLMQLYNAIVQLHFDYGDLIYNSASITIKTRLQKLQIWAARLISGSSSSENRNAMSKKLGWLSLRDFNKHVFVDKYMNSNYKWLSTTIFV